MHNVKIKKAFNNLSNQQVNNWNKSSTCANIQQWDDFKIVTIKIQMLLKQEKLSIFN